jgi:hypothetical protein
MVWRGTNAIASWAWKGCEGNRAVVEVYADADSAVLLLNEKRIGRKNIKNCKAVFTVKYAPGILTAIAYNAKGEEVSRSSLVSAGGKIRISIKPEKDTVRAGEIVYADISLCGENGVVESNGDTKLSAVVEGGELLAFGSANPCTEENYNSGSFTTYYGRAQAVVRSKEAGIMRITVQGASLASVQAVITVY